jgi:hypothetical protein
MTMPMTLSDRRRLAPAEWPAALVAVGVARVLARCSPYRIARVLGPLVRSARRPATPDEAGAAREVVVSASRMCAGQYCLQRSIAVVVLLGLRRRGVTLCTGVRTRPFAAHAWVETVGSPVGEPPDVASFHRTMTVP